MSMNVPPRKYASFRVEGILHERDLMPRIGVMICFHVDSYVKGVHLKNTSGCPWPKATVKPLCEIQVPKLRSHILKITS
jgi:hypothetical protein